MRGREKVLGEEADPGPGQLVIGGTYHAVGRASSTLPTLDGPTLAGSSRRRPSRAQRLLSMNAVSWDFVSAPTCVATTLPSLNSIRVGTPRMPYFMDVP